MSEPIAGWSAALGRVPSGLFIVTARQADAETGMLASWIQQCSFDPPLLSVAVRRDRAVADWLTPGAAFVVNILETDQTNLLIHFGKGFAPGQHAFVGLDVERRDGLPPILADALAFLACAVEQRFSTGDHELIVGRIQVGDMLQEGHPMIHVRKNGLRY